MAGNKRLKKDKMALEFVHIFVVVNVFNVITSCVGSIETHEPHGQVFIQTANRVEGYPLNSPEELFQKFSISDIDEEQPSVPVTFEPPTLDFRDQPVGILHMQQVTVVNRDPEHSLHLFSIRGSTLHFHCSFFQDKMVPPGGNTTFDVVFLARQEGSLETTLVIETSHQASQKIYFRYKVSGVGVPNPYRIRPFIGAKVPINSSFSPLIHVHNPHSSTLQVIEMYSSGGDLHLELPTGEREAPRHLWEIPPYETKPVMKASFIGREENNHTAFIRIKTTRDKLSEVLTLPVEVEVTASPGIFSPVEVLDFGIVRTFDEPKHVRLSLMNSGTKPIHIYSVTVSPPNDAISIEFRPVKLQPDIVRSSQVAVVSFTASKAIDPKLWSGRIVIKSRNVEYKLSIPYHAKVLTGSLVYNASRTLFYTGDPVVENITRDVKLTNSFNFTVVVYNMSLPVNARASFSILSFSKLIVLAPGRSVSVCRLKFHPNSTHLHFTTQLVVHTNASTFSIPIVVYNGQLKVVHHRPEIFQGQLDFGTLGVGEQRSMTFTLRNDNPVDIVIREFTANMERTTVKLLGIERGNGTMLSGKHNTSQTSATSLVLPPYHYAVFNVSLVAPEKESTYAAEVIIITQFQNLYIPMTLRTAEGSLTSIPEKVVFEGCFPGKIAGRELRIQSSFTDFMQVRQITFQPNDSRFSYKPPPKSSPNTILLVPHQESVIGTIYFNARQVCQEDCYVGLPTYVPAGHQWLLGLMLDRKVADVDQYLYTRFRQKWQQIGNSHQSAVNVTLQLDTNQVRGFLFPAQAHLHWPALLSKQYTNFPLTQIGNLSVIEVTVENPADVPVLVQILSLSLYPHPQTILDLVGDRLPEDLVETDDRDIFILPDIEKFNSSPSVTVKRLRDKVENTLGVKPHKRTITMLMEPGQKERLRVGFRPKDDLPRTSLILVRNNLTIIETMVLQGQGGRGEMRFSNKPVGSQLPLKFDMNERNHLKHCHKGKQSRSQTPNFTVKRPFTAKNTGVLPFYVHGFSVNDQPCEGYGFKVLDCQGFELKPNSSQKIDIAFTPDFTMSRIQRTLSIWTSLGPPINFTLQATLPVHMLSKCAAALPRPSWEPILYYSAISLIFFVLFCILVASYFEAERIVTADIFERRGKVSSSTQTLDKSKFFDLRNLPGLKLDRNNRLPFQLQKHSISRATSPAQVASASAVTLGALSQSHHPASNGHITSATRATPNGSTSYTSPTPVPAFIKKREAKPWFSWFSLRGLYRKLFPRKPLSSSGSASAPAVSPKKKKVPTATLH